MNEIKVSHRKQKSRPRLLRKCILKDMERKKERKRKMHFKGHDSGTASERTETETIFVAYSVTHLVNE